MASKMSVLELIQSSCPYLRSAMVRFPGLCSYRFLRRNGTTAFVFHLLWFWIKMEMELEMEMEMKMMMEMEIEIEIDMEIPPCPDAEHHAGAKNPLRDVYLPVIPEIQEYRNT